MKVIADNKIPYLKGILEEFAEVQYLPGNRTGAREVADADALITRTRTQCSRNLLEGSKVSFIASATIGFDHIDTEYCKEKGITWTNAPGCNSESVNQYIAAALLDWAEESNEQLQGKTIGIIGVGHVGSKVARTAALLGMNVLLNDPPRAREEGPTGFCSLEDLIREADIISLHVPLNRSGQDRTLQLFNQDIFEKIENQVLIINTCRGEVINTQDLKNALNKELVRACIIDCWENEPGIDRELLEKAYLATPHIAGYSRDGKAMGTAHSIRELAKHFDLPLKNWYPEYIEPPMIGNIYLDGSGFSKQQIISHAVKSTYNIRQDDKNLRQNIDSFEAQRGDYPIRREFPAYKITTVNLKKETIEILEKLGFEKN
ncbi:MAG: 4-phosphoerythronate dehydrogenase PdxB [Bacteroidetes bacterium]|jgi:erythronate-4-phosphate dehydrogenase|nr:4-phosphoerythronate dehydrogenase PdxB [Bacteroidota bacterium]MBT3750798.1 4-phosphoerythronate dehydrogenase PdxB [Bacteroidota bacterium]MBT4399884.1 4-phosphoerythronate dehydrogenase PdxB [Bacteroidota bacterium]MBT4409852.1 4-phosphoerythronate dehydrogenase PdxB [Bacteroidota bacterium]MBT7094598.1 4-phosphoerythronate dehydrogenase PdxB [Bacteroidota bacterium]